jgi:hypothetical protein
MSIFTFPRLTSSSLSNHLHLFYIALKRRPTTKLAAIMSDQLSPEERYDLATKLIVQSPPGQVNDVIAGKSPPGLLATFPEAISADEDVDTDVDDGVTTIPTNSHPDHRRRQHPRVQTTRLVQASGIPSNPAPERYARNFFFFFSCTSSYIYLFWSVLEVSCPQPQSLTSKLFLHV